MLAFRAADAAGLVAALLLGLAGCGDHTPDPALTVKLDYRQGVEAIAAHDFAAAERHLAAAAQLAPDDPYVALNLGVAYQNLGELEKARAAYRHAVEIGEGVKPVRVTDPHYAGRTVADLARDNLASLPPP
jgi:Tfp pilus assembly protein PilF